MNPLLKRMRCGRKKLICYTPRCCRRDGGKDHEDEKSLESAFIKYFDNEAGRSRESLAENICFSAEVKQVIAVFFCFGIGVVWYIFRMDYEVNLFTQNERSFDVIPTTHVVLLNYGFSTYGGSTCLFRVA